MKTAVSVATVPLWTPDFLAAYLGVPVRTLERWRYLGSGPAFVRVGRHVRYRPESVELWLQKGS